MQPFLRRLAHPAATLGTALAAAAVLGACGGDDGSTTAAGTPSVTASATQTIGPGHNDTNVEFAQMMRLHHQQAIDLAALAPDRSTNPEVLALATQIATAQGTEIDTMASLLTEWGEEVPDEMAMDDMDHSQMDHAGVMMAYMTGMASEDDLAKLETLEGAAFDRLFLKLMNWHHGGAIAMAEAEQAQGENEDLIGLAAQMHAVQTAEMETIAALIKSVRQ